jgi:hypothetical protein
MAGVRVHPIRGALVCLSLLVFLSVGDALAQSNPSAPATLRLAQVVVRLPHTYLFASAQDENGNPFSGQWGKLSALIGPNHEKVDINQQPGGIGIVFLIDISKSLSPQQFAMIRESVHRWINLLGPNDRAAIVTFGSRVTTVVDFTADKSALISALANPALKPSDQQTLLYQGLVQAIDLSRRLDPNLPLRRAIVVLTDGMDDQQGGAGRQEVLDKLAVDPVPIYGLGAAKRFDAKVDTALKDFSALVRASGGDYRPIVDISMPMLDPGRLNEGYIGLRKIVDSTKPLSAECPQCAPDGSPIVIRLFMSYEDTRLTRLSSESVTVRSVDLEGKVVQQPPPATGILALRVSPPVAVLSLDGKPAGSAANFRQVVSAGPHDLEISAVGYQSRQETVTVPAGGEKSMEIALVKPTTTGILALRVSPSKAVLSLDGKPAGPAANFRREVSAGAHDLEISAVGYRTQQETVTVPAGGEKSREFTLVETQPPENWLRLVYKFFRALPLQWLIPLALFIGVSIPGIVILLRRPKPEPPEPGPKVTTQGPVLPNGLSVSPKVLITTHTQQDKQRLRLYPIGHSDIGPFDLLFEKTLAVGRSPDSEICISNDEQVSASHCALSPKGKFILVEDAGSRNGTRVNGVPINGFLHAEPDSTLGVGRTELRMKLLPVGAR